MDWICKTWICKRWICKTWICKTWICKTRICKRWICQTWIVKKIIRVYSLFLRLSACFLRVCWLHSVYISEFTDNAQVKWGWKAYTTPVRVFAASISVLLTDLASCLFSVGQHGGLEDNMMVIVIETAEGHF